MNTDGFVSRTSKFRINNIRLLNKIHITRAWISQGFFQETAGGGDCWGRLQILDVLSHTHDFSAPANTGLFVDLHSYRESLLLYLNVSELMNWASCEVSLALYRQGNWERDVTHPRSHKMSGDLWSMHSSSPLGDASLLLLSISVPTGCAAGGCNGLVTLLLWVSPESFCNSSSPSLCVKSLSICFLSGL